MRVRDRRYKSTAEPCPTLIAAIQTLVCVDDAVRSVYEPGIRIALDVEDIEFEFMETQKQEVIDARETYIKEQHHAGSVSYY